MSVETKNSEHRRGKSSCSQRDGCGCAGGLAGIDHCIVVLSGKGGVGKSTVAVNLAAALKLAGKRVGLLDVDIHGPSVPKLLHLEGTNPERRDDKLAPVDAGGVSVMSIGFLLHSADEALIWRGPMKHKAIQQLIEEVEWGPLDYLVVDCPPGTGDEPLSVIQLLQHAGAAGVVVTTPQDLAIADVRRSIYFCRHMGMPVVGLVENMSELCCPDCRTRIPLFGSGGGEKLAQELGVPFLGKIPIDPGIVLAGDSGRPHVVDDPHSEVSKAFGRVMRAVLAPELEKAPPAAAVAAEGRRRIALPVADGRLCLHFGHSDHFAVFDVGDDGPRGPELLVPPPHEPGVLPVWLAGQRVTTVIAGGMGARAQSLLREEGIEVVVGAPAGEPAAIVEAFLAGTLETGANVCDH